jgi:RalA-binding protein 1
LNEYSLKSTSDIPNERVVAPVKILSSQPLRGPTDFPMPAMAGSASTPRMEAKGAPRNSSMDSAISAVSGKSHSHSGSHDSQPGTPDIANLVKTAGSPEAVIQYLLKEKQSQAQQNSQLWRLVDKQRAMILGLNKDLERALKDKERYRKKLKEVMAAPELLKGVASRPPPGRLPEIPAGKPVIPRVDVNGPKEQMVVAPDSPTLDSDSQKHSPIDMAMAPYPITPPADQPAAMASAVGEMLDPAHAMPKAYEHAFDQFDHEAEDRAVHDARKEKESEQLKEFGFNISLPPSRSLPSEPPRVPPPKPPTSLPPSIPIVGEAATSAGQDLVQFPVPPPRKPPPAPLQLAKGKKGNSNAGLEEEETDSDYDDILEVDEIIEDKRGRRRTREEDDRIRTALAEKEAEMRSLSKKSKSPTDAEGTVVIPPSPRVIPASALQRENIPASLAGMLNGDERTLEGPSMPLLSPGLPSSPRPFAMKSPMNSPPMSPRGMGAFPTAGPLSPRPPRQAIPLPPNTPLTTPPSNDAVPLTTPKPLNIVKKPLEGVAQPIDRNRGSPTERTRIFRGLVTEDYPDLLLAPNALPSIQVRVASSRMKPSRASLLSLTQLEEDPVFTLAVFSRSDQGELWRVEKDSMSLAKLDQRLKQCPAFTAKTPERSLFSGHAPAKLDARRTALNQYLDELLDTPLDTATALELCRYLSTNTLPPNADETGSVRDTSVESSVVSTGPGGRPLKTGYLTKRGKNFGGWKARFFVLDGPQLKYYETPGGAHLGTIKLQNAQIGKQAQSNENLSPARGGNPDDLDNQYRHAFLVLEPKKKDSTSHVKHVLCAESDRERDQWVDALLQWIDYRDPEEDESHAHKSAAHDRQGSGGSERQQGANAKKKAYGQNRPHQGPDSDNLIGVSYDSTRAGDMPQGAPRRRTSVGLPDNPQNPTYSGVHVDVMASQAPVISAPRDPQVISDSSSWGNKLMLPPSNEDKKQRKRSFFGFGPKTRSSSDGQDSLFGTEGATASTPPQGAGYQGPVRQVFGAPLAEAVRYNAPVDVNVPLPAVVFRCIQYLDAKNAIGEEGIFRLSGSNVVIKQLRERFNNESDIDLVNDENYYDIHAVASLLKLYLRELPTTILTRDLHLEFLSVTEMAVQREKIAALGELVQRLPQANGTLLRYLISFLIKIINNADRNKMTVRNVGIVFSPTLNIPAPVFAMFLQNYEGIFGMRPEEYELPSPVHDHDHPPSRDGLPGRPSFEPHPRPSTSGNGASASPSRQRLLDAMMEQQRSTGGTPPPLLMGIGQLNSSRNTATPPPSFPPGPASRQNAYEPQYLSQQQGISQVSLRPAYESGFVVPQGYDPMSYPQPPRQNPGYDRPIYQNSHENENGGYEQQQYGLANKRRESAVFMGNMMGLNPQGSKSRLREESRM